MKKILLILILFLFTVGTVAAVNPDDFKIPNGYEKVGQGTGGFYEFKNGSNLLDIYDWDGLYNIWFGNYEFVNHIFNEKLKNNSYHIKIVGGINNGISR